MKQINYESPAMLVLKLRTAGRLLENSVYSPSGPDMTVDSTSDWGEWGDI